MKHAASVHPEPGSNSPLSEKFMSLVHISMNRSTSLSFCPFHFSQNQQVFIVFSYSIVNVLFFALEISSYLIALWPPSVRSPSAFNFLCHSVQRHLLSYHLNFYCQHFSLKKSSWGLRFPFLLHLPKCFHLFGTIKLKFSSNSFQFQTVWQIPLY